jgi:hypothetical protein
VTWLALAAVAAWGLRVGTLAHPFLLADNRHFTFYLWRRLLGHPKHGSRPQPGTCSEGLFLILLSLRSTDQSSCSCLSLNVASAQARWYA